MTDVHSDNIKVLTVHVPSSIIQTEQLRTLHFTPVQWEKKASPGPPHLPREVGAKSDDLCGGAGQGGLPVL